MKMRDFKLVIFLFIVSIVLTISKANAFTFANGTNRSLVNNIGEEYRWNTPLLTYAYDESFINYFGENGILAIEDAIELLNSIPAASTLRTNYPPANRMSTNLWNFPVRPDRYHARADTLQLIDMKSYAVRELFGFMGLGDAEDNAFQLDIGGAVTLRNYDPISRQPSKYVNGSLLSYVVLAGTNAVTFPVDVMKPAVTLASASMPAINEFGKFVIGPTRDDVGGLKELYRKDNFNIEPLPANTFQIVTNQPNLTNPAIYSIDLRWFSKESKTNTVNSFRQFVATNQWWGPVYTNLSLPPLVILETNINWKMVWSTNVTPYLTNFPWTPVGQPPTLVYLTNKFRVFQPSYDYVFGNVITNIHVPKEKSKILYRSWEIVPKAPLWSVVGSVPTTTNYNLSVINDDYPHGEIIILPTTNVVGYHFTDMMFERLNTLTNILTDTNSLANPNGALPGQGGGLGAGGEAITNFVGLMEDEVWTSTNHAYLAYPIVYSTNNILVGGVDKISFKQFQPDSWVTTNYSSDRFLEDYSFPNLENQTFNYIFPNAPGSAGAIGSAALTNASMPSIRYTLDYVEKGKIKKGTFLKFYTGPDIIFSAANLPYIFATQSVPPQAVNNNAINGFQVLGLNGPGNIVVPPNGFQIVFNKIGTFWNPPVAGSFLNEESMSLGWKWGYFNGRTDDPIVFPEGESVRNLENEIFKP